MLWGEDSPVWQGRPGREGGRSRPHQSLGQHLAPPCSGLPPHHLPQEHKAEVKALMREQWQPSTNTGDAARQHSIQTQEHKPTSQARQEHRELGPLIQLHYLSIHPSQPRAGQGYTPCKAQALPSNKLPARSVKGHVLGAAGSMGLQQPIRKGCSRPMGPLGTGLGD